MAGELPEMLSSPCTANCKLDPTQSHCESCLRSMNEIIRWARMLEEDRRKIMAALPQRRAQAEAARKPQKPRI